MSEQADASSLTKFNDFTIMLQNEFCSTVRAGDSQRIIYDDRARRGVSGALNPQSAIAGLNPLSEVLSQDQCVVK